LRTFVQELGAFDLAVPLIRTALRCTLSLSLGD
jgi:hypothetical protein